MLGDLQPVDSDPSQPGDQLQYDQWGNVITTAQAAPDRDDSLYGEDDTADLIQGGGGNDILFGDTAQLPAAGPRTNPVSSAVGAADWIQGGAGRDYIDAGPGDDLVEGGADGVSNGDVGGDVVDAGSGNDEVYGDVKTSPADAIAAGNLENATNQKGDFLSGGAGDDWVVGAQGNDVLSGGDGGDLLIGGAGNDDIWGDRDLAAGIGWSVQRQITVVNGIPQFFSNYSGVVVRTDGTVGGDDVIYGGSGDDWIAGEAGDDFIDGGADNDALFGMSGNDILIGGSGDDWLFGDFASAQEGADYLDGGTGNDHLYGDGGGDILIGGQGDDTLAGGAGKDIYIYNRGDGVDVIDDVPADADGADASVLVLGPGITREQIKFRTGSLLLDLGEGDAIHFEGFDPLNPTNTPLTGEIRFADGEALTYADILAQGFDIDGTEGDDDGHDAAHPMLTGTGVTDRIRGFGGNDILAGFGGDDVLDGGTGNDELQGGDRPATIISKAVRAPIRCRAGRATTPTPSTRSTPSSTPRA